MKKAAQVGKILAYAMLSLLLLAIIAAAVSRARIPRYNGVSVEQWFARAEQHWWRGNFGDDETKLIQFAFERMGSNAVPFLIEKFTFVPTETDLRRDYLFQKLRAKRWIPQPIKDLLPNAYSHTARQTAHELLRALVEQSTFAQPTLEQILSRPGPTGAYLDYEILELFERMGEKASNSSPVVARCFASTNQSVDHAALRAFAAITPKGSPDSKLLREALAAGEVRASDALRFFEKWDLPMEEFFPHLGRELCSTNGMIHNDALATIKYLKLHHQVLMPSFATAMSDPDPRVRAQWLQALRTLGNAGSRAIPAVLASLDDEFSYVRVEAVQTLHALEPDLHARPEAMTKLKSMLSDPSEHVVETDREALKNPGPSASAN